nr:ribosome biogenesis protein [Cryptomonas curvata]
MRILKLDEARTILIKIIKFQGIFFKHFIKKHIQNFQVFRILKKRVFFASIIVISRANSFASKKIGSIGTCIGIFNKSSKFYFLISALNFLTKFSKFNSIFINETGEKIFTYGKHLKKIYIIKITKELTHNDGVIVLGKKKIPIGLGEIIKDFLELSKISDKETVIINQADVGKYIRISKHK